MIGSTSLLLDASTGAWSEFVAALGTLAVRVARDGAFAYVRPPRGCAREAARAVRALRIEDHVHLLASGESPPMSAAALTTATVVRFPLVAPPSPRAAPRPVGTVAL